MSKVSAFVYRLLFPYSCSVCQEESLEAVCPYCWHELLNQSKCPRCERRRFGVNLCECSVELQADGFLAISSYEKTGKWIREAKDSLDPYIHPISGEDLFSLFLEHFKLERSSTDVVLVPSSGGENWIEKLLEDSSDVRLLSPLRRNPAKLSQKHLKREERLKNAMKLFYAVDEYPLESENVLLIDDVISTGGSSIACISLLRRLGYKRVFVAFLAAHGITRGIENE